VGSADADVVQPAVVAEAEFAVGVDHVAAGQACQMAGRLRLRGKLGGSRADWKWQRPHLPGLNQRSQFLAHASGATMAWKRSGVRVP